MIERSLQTAGHTETLGQEMARWLSARAGAVVYLTGPLGSGKTTLARGVLRGLGVQGAIRSPTYTLMEPYEIAAGSHLIHMDLYRLRSALEVEQLGLRDYPPESNWWLVEWPELGGTLLPPPDLTVELSVDGNGRRARIEGWS